MSTHHLRTSYMSGWYTVILPTLITLAIWAAVFFGGLILLNWDIPSWLGVLLCFGGWLPGLFAAMVTYPFLLRLTRYGEGELLLEGSRLRWRKGRRWHEVNFAQPHKVKIAAGTSGQQRKNAVITFYPDLEQIHLSGAQRADVLEAFPEPNFVDDLAILPEEGSWGFKLSTDNAEAVRFFTALLELLWNHRQQNEHFRLYQKFPWGRLPRPAFHHIRFICPDEQTPEEKSLLQDLEGQFVDDLSDSAVRLTPDYLVGRVPHKSPKPLSGKHLDTCIMPLGEVSAQISITGSEGACFLHVQGAGENGHPLALRFDWYGVGDSHREEADFVVRFVQAMKDKTSSVPER